MRAGSALALAALVAACSSSSTGPGPQPPASVEASIAVSGGDAQTAPAGQAVSSAPEVRVTDAQGQGVSGLSVRFTVLSGGGSVAKPSTSTDASGRASAGTWTLGQQAGAQQLRATVSGVGSVTFSAIASSGADPATLQISAGNGQSATVGSDVPTDPEVRVLDAQSNPVAGVTVTFSVEAGGGSVSGATAVSDGSGRAAVDAWTLGTTAGPNRLRASASGMSAATFTATGTAGPPASVAVASGDGQTATAGSPVAVAPTVRVADAHGNPVAGVSVLYAVTSGGGSATGTTPTTDAAGLAPVGGWTLGSTPGSNTLGATVGGAGISGSPVTFTATGVASGGGGGSGAFDIIVRFNPGSSPTSAQAAAYGAAEAKWEAVIAGDLPDVVVSRPAGTCSSPDPIDETIDDLVIWVTLETIDGPGGVLGSAGPCLVRNGTLLPLAGSMRFDTADLATLEANGLLDEVVLHEVGHVLGIGTLWGTLGLLADPAAQGGTDPHFTGAGAIAGFDAVGGAGYAGNKVPVEAGGGSGTQDGHWRESVFDTELMTGWVDFGTNEVSIVTVESLEDLGYAVDPGEADSYGLPASASIVPRAGSASAIRLENDIWRMTLEVLDANGRTVGLIPR